MKRTDRILTLGILRTIFGMYTIYTSVGIIVSSIIGTLTSLTTVGFLLFHLCAMIFVSSDTLLKIELEE